MGPFLFENEIGKTVIVTKELYVNIIQNFLVPQLFGGKLTQLKFGIEKNLIWYQQD